MYYGPIPLSTTIALFCQTKTTAGVPIAADSNSVTYRIYSPSGGSPLLSGTFSTTVVDSQTGLYTATGVALTSANGFIAGNVYIIRIAYAVSTGTNQVQIQTLTVV